MKRVLPLLLTIAGLSAGWVTSNACADEATTRPTTPKPAEMPTTGATTLPGSTTPGPRDTEETAPAAPTTAASQPASDGNAARTASYGIGYSIGQNLKQAGIPVDLTILQKGLQDALDGKEPVFTQEQLQAAMMALQAEMQGKMQNAGMNAEKEGTAFRETNKAKTGVTQTASGLQIETLKEGTGPNPVASDTVKVHYVGTLIDGSKFDSSVDRGTPATFPLTGVISGWTEGLQLVKVGGKAKLVIPPNLAYGPEGRPPQIPPNSTLVFEVELIEIVK